MYDSNVEIILEELDEEKEPFPICIGDNSTKSPFSTKNLTLKSAKPTPENKSYRDSLRSRYRRSNALTYQHEHFRQFNLRVDLLILDNSFNEKQFRRKLSRYCPDNYHADWSIEKSKTDQSHYHAIISTVQTIETIRQYLKDSISDRKGKEPTVNYRLNIETIENPTATIVYQTKASPKLMRKTQPEEKGKRSFFSTGKPFAKPVRQLASSSYRLHLLASDPDLITDYLNILGSGLEPH